jgi:NADH:ubiquinone oxidoreductase subunit 6 (subunit J)
MSVGALLAKINIYILNPVIILGFVVATIVFFYGIVKFIRTADSDTAREEGKKTILYGIVGLFIMFSVFGIVNVVLKTFDIPNQTKGVIP